MWEKCICGGRNVLARGFGYHNASSRGLGACFPYAGGGRPLFWPGPRGGRLRPERGRPTKMGVIRGSRAQSLRPIEPNTVQLGVNARGERSRLRPERGVSTRMGVKHARQEVSITPRTWQSDQIGRKRAHGLARMGGIHRWHVSGLARMGGHLSSQPLYAVVIIRTSGCITSYNGLRGPTPTHTGK